MRRPFTNRTASAPKIDTDKLLNDANSASQTVAAVHVAFIGLLTYFGVIIWGTTHENLLRNSPVKLPILDVEVPLTTFNCGVPWLLVLLHFNLLLQLELLSRKLRNFDHALPKDESGQNIRDQLFIYPFTHLIVGRSNVRITRWLLALVVGITVIALPQFVLLAAQISFLPYHSEAITWSQRLAVWADVLLIIALWPLIASRNSRWVEWWDSAKQETLYWLRCLPVCFWLSLVKWFNRHNPRYRQRKIGDCYKYNSGADAKGVIFLFVTPPIILFISLIAAVPGNTTLASYYAQAQTSTDLEEEGLFFEDWLIRWLPFSRAFLAVFHQLPEHETHNRSSQDWSSCEPVPDSPISRKNLSKDRVMLKLTCFLFDDGVFPRNLDLHEARLIPDNMTANMLAKAISSDMEDWKKVKEEFYGLDLRNRDLRYADLRKAILPKVVLQNSYLQNTLLGNANMQGANLHRANMQGADFYRAKMLDATLTETEMQGANFYQAKMQYARLQAAKMQGANLSAVDMEGTNLESANMQCVDLSNAEMQRAILNRANMQGANLTDAGMQGATSYFVDMQGANLSGAGMQGVQLYGALMQGTNLSDAQMLLTDLSSADMRGARFTNVKMQGAVLNKTKIQMEDIDTANLDYVNMENIDLNNLSKDEINRLIAKLKTLVADDKLKELQARLRSANNQAVREQPDSLKSCLSGIDKHLNCEFHTPNQLPVYQAKLNQFLLEQVCQAMIEEDVASLILTVINDPDRFKALAGTLVKELEAKQPCRGLATIPDIMKENLIKQVRKQAMLN